MHAMAPAGINWRYLLCHDPASALNEIHRLLPYFIEHSADHTTIEDYQKCVHRFEYLCPFILLSECSELTSGAPCAYSRAAYPARRRDFENQVVAALVHALDTSVNQTASYVSFASGGLFQDLVILTKVYLVRPAARILMHCIDPLMDYYPIMRISNGLTPWIDPKMSLNYKLLARQLRARPGLYYSDLTMTYQAIRLDLQFSEIYRWIGTQFPYSQLYIYPYATVAHFLSARNIYTPIDVVAAIDIAQTAGETIEQDYINLYFGLLETGRNCSYIYR
jgi:hypothetical protein